MTTIWRETDDTVNGIKVKIVQFQRGKPPSWWWTTAPRRGMPVGYDLYIWIETRRTLCDIRGIRYLPLRKQLRGEMTPAITRAEIDEVFARIMALPNNEKGKITEWTGNEFVLWDIRVANIPAVVDILKRVLANEP